MATAFCYLSNDVRSCFQNGKSSLYADDKISSEINIVECSLLLRELG